MLALVDDIVPGGDLVRAQHLAVELGQRFLAGRVDEEPTDHVQEVVPGGTGDRPGRGESLVALEDLLDDDVGAVRLLVQPAQVPDRVAQAVDVVDPEALQPQPLDQVEDGLVGRGEDPPALDAQADEGGDVEEAPVVELLAGRPPEGQAVVLALEEGVEGVGVVVGGSHRSVHAPSQVGVLFQQAG